MRACVPAYVVAYVVACRLTYLFALSIARVVHRFALGVSDLDIAPREVPRPRLPFVPVPPPMLYQITSLDHRLVTLT